MQFKRLSFLFLIIAIAASSSIFAQVKLPPVNVKEYTLKNGMRVITHIDRSTPVVTVGTWYHVGSKNEVTGRTGFAHLFEHMM